MLAFERIDRTDQWQLPQGGIDDGECAVDGVWRELKEETGLGPDDVELVAEFHDWTVYEWPEAVQKKSGVRLGQAQRWFFFDARRDDIVPTPDGVEFSDWKWVKIDWLIDQVVEFRKASYLRVLGGST